MPLITHLNPIPRYGIGGTDLLIPFRLPDGRTGYAGGDSFTGDRPRVGGGEWHSPIILISEQRDVGRPIEFTDAMRGARQIIDYPHNNRSYSTVLPCDFISIGDRIYGWLMFTQGLGNEKWCHIVYSDDLGKSWTLDPHKWSTSEFGGKRTMISWERGDDGWVYIVSTGGLARNKNMLLWRAPEDRLTDPGAWQGWGWNGRDWAWGRTPSDILPPGTKLGEICLRRIQGNWILSGFDAGAYNLFVKVGDSPLANWHTAPDYRPVKGAPQMRGGPDVVSRLYGGYVDPNSRFDGAFALIVSEWQLGDEPYRASQYRIDGIRPVVTPTEQEWDMATAKEVHDVVKGSVEAGKGYDSGREDGHNDGTRSLFGMVQRALWELTLWMKEPTASALADSATKKATMLGHSVRAAAWGRINHAKLTEVGNGVLDCQVKLDHILANQKVLADKAGIDPTTLKG